jgi:hypothetical protein
LKNKISKEFSFKSPSENIFYFLESFILKIIIESWEEMPPAVFQFPQEEDDIILSLPYFGNKYFQNK